MSRHSLEKESAQQVRAESQEDAGRESKEHCRDLFDNSMVGLYRTAPNADMMFRVRCWIETYEETRRIIDKLNTVVVQALTEANIEMPYPQLDVHLIHQQPNPIDSEHISSQSGDG